MRGVIILETGQAVISLLRQKYYIRDSFYNNQLIMLVLRIHGFAQYIFACFRASAWITRNQPRFVLIFTDLII